MFRFLLLTTSTWAMLPLRFAVGIIFIAHGMQKIFGVFGGRGFEAWMNTQVPIPLEPIKLWLAIAAFAELLGGAMVLFGLLTRVGAFLIFCVMSVAVFGIHWRYGFFIRDSGVDGIEFAFILWAAAIALMFEGGGRGSFDANM